VNLNVIEYGYMNNSFEEIIEGFFLKSPRGQHYLNLFKDFYFRKKVLHPNLIAALFGPLWLMYRGLLLLFLAFISGQARMHLGFSYSESGTLIYVVQAIVCGFFGEYLFYRTFRNRIDKMISKSWDNDEIITKLKNIYPKEGYRM
jgi:hypothetical protein